METICAATLDDPYWFHLFERFQPAGHRAMPSRWAIALYWWQLDTFEVDLEQAHCFRCRWRPRETTGLFLEESWNALWIGLDKAHLVDRVCGGFDTPRNLVPLCGACHRQMPMHQRGQRDEAISWVQTGPWWRSCAG